MKARELKDIDIEDIEYLLPKVEDSFNFRFEGKELSHVKTYGQLCDAIKSKIKFEHAENCTSQQAFYKLRNAIKSTAEFKEFEITPTTQIEELLPRKTRKQLLNKIENNLGFSLAILEPASIVTGFLSLTTVTSLILLLYFWQLSLLLLGLTIIGFWWAKKTGKELKVDTIGQLTKKMTSENYMNARRDRRTVNRNEIDNIINTIFSENLGVAKSKLTKDARLY